MCTHYIKKLLKVLWLGLGFKLNVLKYSKSFDFFGVDCFRVGSGSPPQKHIYIIRVSTYNMTTRQDYTRTIIVLFLLILFSCLFLL